ncbi:MAG: hypothetical protein WAW75_09130 [Gallionella sp.]
MNLKRIECCKNRCPFLWSFYENKLCLIFIFILSGCATGERWSGIDEGMTKTQVQQILGKQDQIEKRDNGWSIHYYKNRLISGWSWDKTDYYVVYNPDDKVDSYGHGAVDTRTSERMAKWSATQQLINQQNQPKSVNCTSTVIGNTATTDCTGH